MSQLKKRYGSWAVVVGSAMGIGASFSEQLARQGFNLILVDHQEEKILNQTKQLIERYSCEIIPLVVDLNNEEASYKILEQTQKVNCRLMIYNAAFSLVKQFGKLTNEELDCFLQVNVATQLKLVHGFVHQLKAQNQPGGILLMSSLAGLLGVQFVSTYAATKAFTWNLAESLHFELKKEGIDVSACLAGATLSETYIQTKPEYGLLKPQVQSPEEVAKFALNNLGSKPMFISGFFNRLNYFILLRLLPRKIAARIANKAIADMYSYAGS